MLKLFDPVFLRKLQVLQINSRRASLRGLKGELLTAKKGSSLEFMEYKEYCFGDEFKHIDWNIYGRLEKLYVRTFHGEKSLAIYVFIDASRSMLLPRKDNKYEYALKTALALSYVGLINHNSLKIVALAGSSSSKAGKSNLMIKESPFFYDSNDIFKIARFLETISPDGQADLSEGIKQVISKNRGMGTAIIISDFWTEPEFYQQAISYLHFKNFDIDVIHLLGEEEVSPAPKLGKVKVKDVETGEQKVVALGEQNRRRFIENIKLHQQELQKFCLRNKASYVRAGTGMRVEDFVLQELPKMKLLR